MAAESENDLVLHASTLPLVTQDGYFNALPFVDNNSDSTAEDYAERWASSVSKRWFSVMSHYVYRLYHRHRKIFRYLTCQSNSSEGEATDH